MNTAALFSFGHNRLDSIKRRIMDAHIRLVKGGSEWVEGSLDIALALREGREAVPVDITFGDWLKQNNLAYYNKSDRAALINLASDPELARTVLAESNSTSYQLIWRANKGRFHINMKPPKAERSPTNKRQRVRMPGRAQLFRTMKLGEEAMNRIKNTSLDSSDEMDELVMLNRGAPDGTLSEIVTRLIDAAAKGEAVSAVAEGVAMGGRRGTMTLQLMTAWKRRMTAPWKLAKSEQRIELVRQLLCELDPVQRDSMIETMWDEERKQKGA